MVDDTKTMRMIVQAVLAGQNCRFDEAEDGHQAYLKIKQKQYDVIITDIHMPVINGLDLCRKVRQELKFKNLPILVMTTDTDYNTVEKVFKAGATDFINKPINELELVSRVQRIFEQRATEKALYLAKADALQANERKSRFLAKVNHELKNPLNGIYGFAQMLHEMESDPQKREMIDVLVRGSEHMTTMVNQLLELDTIEAGSQKIQRMPFNLLELVNQAVSLNRPMIQSKNITVDVDVGSELTVTSDRKLFYSVHANLLSNAIKYNRQDGRIAVSACASDNAVVLTLADTGIGMTEDQLSTIYEAFTRFADSSVGAEGHGLGMAITKSTVDALGMELFIRSELDKGTSATLVIPS